MNPGRLHDALQDGLDALSLGQGLETALGLHPSVAADIQPALEAALALRALPLPEMPVGARRRSWARLQAALVAARPKQWSLALAILPRVAGGLAAAALAVVMGLGGLAVASAQALPGDVLYPVKRASEAVQLRLTLPPVARLTLEDRYATRRADEVRRLLGLGRRELVTFEGIVQGQSETSWLVADIRVGVPTGTSFPPGIASGMTVEVRGETQPEGHFLAEAIQLLGFQYVGPVRFISGESWTVGGQSFAILPDTWIEPGIQLGQLVLVSVRYQPSSELAGRAVLAMLGEVRPTPTPSAPITSPSFTLPPEPEGSVPTPATDQPEMGDGSEEGAQTGSSGGSQGENTQNDEVEFAGVVESRSTSIWVISGTIVHIDSETEINDDPQVGDTIRVKAVTQADGQLRATRIEKAD